MYANEKNCLILLSLLKAYDINTIVVSPGGTNVSFVLSVQNDPFFKLFSAVDERHAAYMACGIAEETGHPVVIVCTGATASRNYMPGLTEAYYRKLPVLAITCSMHHVYVGSLRPQVTDRTSPPLDAVKVSVQCPIPNSDLDDWDCELKMSRAILALTHRGGGPAHINLETSYTSNFDITELPSVRGVRRVVPSDAKWPLLPKGKKIAVWIGSHHVFNADAGNALHDFVKSNNAVVLGDLTSNCRLDEFVCPAIVCYQSGASSNPAFNALMPDLIIRIGEISGDYATLGWLNKCPEIWRVSEDGELRAENGNLSAVFEMGEADFFGHYASGGLENSRYANEWKRLVRDIQGECPDIPFSSLYIARRVSRLMPRDAGLYLGILNPLRCMNLVGVDCACVHCNVGGFGIDGNISSMIGASLVHADRLSICIVGDLSFFYDMNAIGNRHIGSNVRIIVVNNGEGGEFSTPGSVYGMRSCGDKVHDFIAAKGHFGGRDSDVVRASCESLGFKYLSASEDRGFDSLLGSFFDVESPSPIVLECKTSVDNDRAALEIYSKIRPYSGGAVRNVIGSVLPDKVKEIVRGLKK